MVLLCLFLLALGAAQQQCPSKLDDGVCLKGSEIIRSVKGDDVANCCKLCSAEPLCVAYNVNNDTTVSSGNKCYLRSTYKPDTYAPGAPCKSAQLRDDSGPCGGAQRFGRNVCLSGAPNVKKVADYTGSAADCCALCGKTASCVAWTWGFDANDPSARGGFKSCRLKTALSGGTRITNCTSGCMKPGCQPKPKPPTPPPTPPPPTPIPAPTPPPQPAAGKRPHILAILVDDFGWANAGWHRPAGWKEVQTPNMDALVAEGLELDRAYAYKSGRLPVHVNRVNLAPDISNPSDPVSGFAAIPRNMTGIATKMRAAGYKTHQVGKWDAGMATFDHTPQGRGYDTSFGYFHHANDYWTEQTGHCRDSAGKARDPVDLWDTDHGASTQNGTTAAQPKGSVEAYEEYKFEQHVLSIIEQHDPKDPLFLNYDMHIVHEPLEVPDVFLQKFDFIANSSAKDFKGNRQHYHAMVNFADAVLGNVTALLKAKGMWEDTIITLQSDNGGPSWSGSGHTANNFPLKGTKMANWEGGVRTNAFVSGGFIKQVAPQMVGKKLEGYVHVCDWYATFAALAGASARDERGAIANLPPVDCKFASLFACLMWEVPNSPRDTIHMDEGVAVRGDLKLLKSESAQACWAGPYYPNGTADAGCNRNERCGQSGGCLYNITADPSEYVNLATDPAYAGHLAAMNKLVDDLDATLFTPNRGKADPKACDQADKNGNFWGPWIN
eukprot:g373.t1